MERIYHLEDILDCIQGPYEIRGSNAAFHSAKNIEEAGEGCISWISESRSRDATFSQTVGASVVVAHTAVLDHYRERSGQVVVATEQPRVSFAAILHKLFWERPAPGVHPTAIVHPEATIGLHVHIGAFAIIGKCRIGNDAVIHSHCVLHDRVCLGERVVIKNHTTIGSDGYGYVRLSDGRTSGSLTWEGSSSATTWKLEQTAAWIAERSVIRSWALEQSWTTWCTLRTTSGPEQTA